MLSDKDIYGFIRKNYPSVDLTQYKINTMSIVTSIISDTSMEAADKVANEMNGDAFIVADVIQDVLNGSITKVCAPYGFIFVTLVSDEDTIMVLVDSDYKD